MNVRTLDLQTLTYDTWAPFGTIPSDERTEHDRSDIEFLHADGHVNFIAHSNAELTFGPRGPQCVLLNRHDTHTQTLMPMTSDAYVVVAPASAIFDSPEDFDQVAAFTLPQHSVVTLARGTWHWGPYPIEAETLRLFNIQGRGYADDNTVAWLQRDHNITFEVALP